MVFAAFDYWRFRYRTGHWARFAPHSAMGAAFLGVIPDDAVARLRPGDLIFCSYYGSWISWLISYLTSAEVSHVAVYTGDRTIAHSTLSGVVAEPIEGLFAPGARLLPCCMQATHDERLAAVARASQALGWRYGWHQVGRKAWNILSGRDAPAYRARFLGDIATTLLVLDAGLVVALGRSFALWALVAYVALVVINRLRWRIAPLPWDGNYVKPVDVMFAVAAAGAQHIVDPGALQQQRLLAIQQRRA